MDWDSIFSFSVSPWEMVVRGTLMYWFLFLLFRWVVRRHVGSIALSDILLLVLVADAAQNGMSGDYRSFPEGAILVGTLVAWNMLVDGLSFRFEAFRKFAEPKPLPVIWNGRVLRKNLRQEFVTEDELMAKLREKGIDSPNQVKEARIESDGEFSVIEYGGDNSQSKKDATARKTGVAK
jgi:uncharacterized membrane protein YcaP (DUF421 family)